MALIQGVCIGAWLSAVVSLAELGNRCCGPLVKYILSSPFVRLFEELWPEGYIL